MKILKKRKAKMCPPFCNRDDCKDYYTKEEHPIKDEKVSFWVNHCKEMKKVERQAVNKIK